MPLLRYLADTNVVSGWMAGVEPVVEWLMTHQIMNARVVTRNIKHFPGCDTVDPWTGRELPAWHPPH